ncbi:hypothetical protein FIBSPDRAFT_877404 [Athelia psychrophila]|uniref:Major facilitator superfamily (MFS) profile domain-containing protein n=1 Tax=Athelia psychrophila TaxID=1759441 RepID=A0A167W0L8_9AGAM|nr:hypothetical protein FIBSPDRAFT_877404 [Fibularhizoctonia sp. CBS 109695]
MVIGALVTMVFLFAYTHVRSAAQNLGFSWAISFCLNIYTGTLCSPPCTGQWATGIGIAIAFDRLMGIVSAVIMTEPNTDTSVPIYICAALYGVIAVVAIALPFEPYSRRNGGWSERNL